jgi:hypothetical protein
MGCMTTHLEAIIALMSVKINFYDHIHESCEIMLL